MGDLSNKTLAVFLLGVVVVSLFGTMMILSNLDKDVMTGHATTQTGTVNLSVASTVSITTQDASLVNFGSCGVNESGPIYFNSLNTENNTQYCTNSNLPNNISVRNNGNVVVNVSIATSACSPGGQNSSGGYNTSCTFLNVSTTPIITNNSMFQYQTISGGAAGYTGGCTVPNSTWQNFTGTHEFTACTNLGYNPSAGGNNSFITHFRLRVPAGLGVGLKQVTITYSATG